MPDRKTSRGRELAATPRHPSGRDHTLAGGRGVVRADAIHHVPAVHPSSLGPWAREADKIAWTDAATGYQCIIRRHPDRHHLCGYVAVPPGHPLFGRRAGTLHDHLIGVHGGIDYAQPCERDEPEETSVCHVPDGYGRNGDPHPVDDVWWFGFSCDGAGDVVPTPGLPRGNAALQGEVVARAYRDEAFVHGQCVRLAAQLKAVADGRDPRDADPGPRASDRGTSTAGGRG